MNDNAKCAGVGCPIREHCLRFTRPAVEWNMWILPAWTWGRWAGSCIDHIPLPVEPHGGAQEEGDAC